MISYKNGYKDTKYTFPSRSINPKLKDQEEYCVKNAEAIYSLFLREKTSFTKEIYQNFNTLRLYANGQQDMEQYKGYLYDRERSSGASVSSYDDTILSKESKRGGWDNILYSGVSPAPKIMSMLHGIFDDAEWDIFVDNIDQYSKKLLETEKYMKIVQGQNQQWQNEYKAKAGIPIDENVVLPKSKEEFDMSNASDGFKLNIAKAMEKLMEHSFNVSKWETVVKKKLVDDLAACGYAATRDYYDPEDGFFKTKWLDIARVVAQYSSDSDYNDAEYAGYFNYITVSNLRQKRPDLTEDKIRKLTKANFGYYDKPSTEVEWESFFSKIDPSNNSYRYDTMKVPVFECEWIDFDDSKRLEITNVHGKNRYLKKEYDEEIRPLSEKQKKRGAKQQVKYVTKRVNRQCTWVVGTDIAFDCGMVNMAPRPQPSKPRLTFHIERLMQPSYISQLRPMLDEIQLIWLRWQNSLAKMIERGYAINMHMLMNISDGEKKWKLPDLLKMWKQTGILPFMQSVPGNYMGGDVTPVREIPGGLGTRLEETIGAIELQFKLIEDIVGFNPASMGTTPGPDVAVRNVQAAMQSTNNVLKPLIKAVAEIKTGVGESIMSRLQIALRASKYIRESYAGVISDIDLKLMQIAEKDQVKYGLSMKPRPDAAFRQQLAEYVKAALQSGRDGKAGLEMPQAMLIEEQLYRGGNISEIRQMITYLMDKNKQIMIEEQQKNIQLQNEGLAQIEQQKQQNAMQNLQAEAQADISKQDAETQGELAIKRMEGNQSLLLKLVEQAGQSGEGVDNTDAKRRLSIALRVLGAKGSSVDLAAEIGRAEEGINNAPQGTSDAAGGNISPQMTPSTTQM